MCVYLFAYKLTGKFNPVCIFCTYIFSQPKAENVQMIILLAELSHECRKLESPLFQEEIKLIGFH